MDDRQLRRKLRALARERGVPANVLPHEQAEAVGRLREYHKAGMSYSQLADQMDRHKTTIQKILGSPGRPPARAMRRDTYNAIMQNVHWEEPVKFEGHRRSGAKVSPLPARRKLKALNAAGYPMSWVADYIEYDKRNLSRLVIDDGSKYCYAITNMHIDEVFRKLIDTDPLDVGISPESVARAKSGAAGRGYAPWSCWDEDTINDPDAIPEWTGACGTVRGYYLHLKYDIRVRAYRETARTDTGKQRREVLCEPCRSARTEAARGGRTWVDEDGIREAVAAGGVYRDVAEEFDCSTMTVQRIVNKMKEEGWTPLKSGPRPGKEY